MYIMMKISLCARKNKNKNCFAIYAYLYIYICNIHFTTTFTTRCLRTCRFKRMLQQKLAKLLVWFLVLRLVFDLI